MSEKQIAADEARGLLTDAYDGVLSTISVEVEGYPFGSVTPYCLDRSGRPLILIASIAQHTKNIRANPKVSLIVLDRSVPDLQAFGRVTVLADAEAVGRDERDAIERYYAFFPDARDYHLTHDFHFYRLLPVRVRYIGGFGRIYWLEPALMLRDNVFAADAEHGILEHMNADHGDAMRKYLAQAGVVLAPDEQPVMVGCDAEGMHIRVGAKVIRIRFPAPVTDSMSLRQTLIAMARA